MSTFIFRPMTWEEKYFLECLEQAERERNLPKPVKPRKPRMEKPKPVYKTTLQVRAEDEAKALEKAMRLAKKNEVKEEENYEAISAMLSELLERVATNHPESIVSLMWDSDLPRSTKRKTSEAKEDYDSWKPRWNGTE
jgi:hypothetical protein